MPYNPPRKYRELSEKQRQRKAEECRRWRAKRPGYMAAKCKEWRVQRALNGE